MHQPQGQSLLPIGLDRSGQRFTQSACCGADAGASTEHPGADIHSVRNKLHFLPHLGWLGARQRFFRKRQRTGPLALFVKGWLLHIPRQQGLELLHSIGSGDVL